MEKFTLSDADDVFPGAGLDTSGDDSITALGGNDQVDAGAGNDNVYGGLGEDTLFGGLGDDWLEGGAALGMDQLYGGAGNDVLRGEVCYGGQGDDSLGTEFNSTSEGGLLYGGDGNDLFYHFVGRDTIWAGNGDDTVRARFDTALPDFDSILHGEAGTDVLSFDVYRGFGQVLVTDFSLTVSGDAWTLTLNGDGVGVVDGFEAQLGAIYAGNVTLQGSDGDDRIYIEASTGDLAMGGGNDTLTFESIGHFQIDGGDGADLIEFNLGHRASLFVLDARQAVTTVSVAGVPASTIEGVETWHIGGSHHNDLIYLSDGNDIVTEPIHQSGSDTFYGGAGDDTLDGGRYKDFVSGDAGRDKLFGGAGDDTITGGLGRDYLAAGSGRDVLVFNSLADSGTAYGQGVIDNVTYFQIDATQGSGLYIDRIDLSAIDAMAGVAGDQAFSFIGTAEFSAEGQVRVVQSGTATFLQVNAVGSTGSDMTVCLLAVTAAAIGVEDFIL